MIEPSALSERAPRPDDTLLYLDGVSVSFDGFKAINALSLYVKRQELRCIIGPNGAGKTTMMDLITGRTRPDTGRIVYERDTDLTDLDEAAIACLGIGRKFQKPTVFSLHSVRDNLELALDSDRGVWANLRFRLNETQRGRIDEVLDVIGLRAEAQRTAGELSHGQKQWLEIGMLLMQSPSLMLVDEPAAGMTRAETERTADLLRQLAKDICVVVVEHDMDFVRSIGDRVTVLHQGRVLAEGPMAVVQEDPHVQAVYLERNDVLSVRSLSHHYGESRTLWGIDLDVPQGSRTCLMGRNGVGKTTLLRCLMGLESTSDGSMHLHDAELPNGQAALRARLGIGYVPQGREIFPRLSVEENLKVGLGARRDGLRQVPDSIYEIFPVLRQMRRRRGGDLSGGQQQQLAIGRALTLEPEILILDEPTEGIQPNVVHEIGDIILRLNETLGLTVLLVEQKLPFARRVADRFYLLDKGRVVANGAMADLDEVTIRAHLSV